MPAESTAEEYAKRSESVGGYKVAITSYRIGQTFYAKAEIDLPGAGARIAQAQESTRDAAEQKALADARRLIEKKP